MKKITFTSVLIFLIIHFAYAVAQQNIDEGINELTEQINKYMVEQQKTKIAIIPFPDLQKQEVNILGSFIAEELTTNLFATGKFKIVERSLLKQVLDELKLGQTGIVDANSAKELGKMTGVDAIIAGTITDIGSNIAINCRLIETQSGEVFAAAKTRIFKDKDLIAMIDTSTQKQTEQKEYSKPQTTPIEQKKILASSNDLEFVVNKCSKSGLSVIIELTITNMGKDCSLTIGDLRSGLRSVETNITDNVGNVYKPVKYELGNSDSNNRSVKHNLVKSVPTKGLVTFNIDDEISSISLLQIGCAKTDLSNSYFGSYKLFEVQIRSIPVK